MELRSVDTGLLEHTKTTRVVVQETYHSKNLRSQALLGLPTVCDSHPGEI